MTKQEAREVIHRFAHTCKNYGYTQLDWDQQDLGMFSLAKNSTFEALELVPEIMEHIGYWVWQPMRRD